MITTRNRWLLLIALASLALALPGQTATAKYTFMPLPPLFTANDLSDQREIVGSTRDGAIGSDEEYATSYLASIAGLIELDQLSEPSVYRGISPSGDHIAGWSKNTLGVWVGQVWSWAIPSYSTGPNTFPVAVNNSGRSTGVQVTWGPNNQIATQKVFRSPATGTTLEILDEWGDPVGISTGGIATYTLTEVLGGRVINRVKNWLPNGSRIVIDEGECFGVSSSGATIAGQKLTQATLWTASGAMNLKAGTNSLALDANDAGTAVGISRGRAYLFERGKRVDLNTMVKLPKEWKKWRLVRAKAINNRGDILVTAQNLTPSQGKPAYVDVALLK
ncbi:MAG TPA: hypothetical protein VGE59_00740 [Patescibacteria group bacterium]